MKGRNILKTVLTEFPLHDKKNWGFSGYCLRSSGSTARFLRATALWYL